MKTGLSLKELITTKKATIGIIGLGYVGLPLAVATHRAGYSVLGFDIDPQKVALLSSGRSMIGRISDVVVQNMREDGRFFATSDFSKLALCDVIVICVPTPLNHHREPDLSYITQTTKVIAQTLRQGQLISLESTTYPGTTTEVMRPILEQGGLKSGEDFFLSFSPEREDPGNPDYHTSTIPKVVGGDGTVAQELACLFYGSVVERIVPVSSCEVAEAVKLTENIFRSVNIALVNELKTIYGRMGINIWEVIDAAKTKPFGFMAFYPGPGLGGHCIPIDPFYLSWKARAFDVPTRFIELAGEINQMAPYRVLDTLIDALGEKHGKALSRARILVVGIAYKKNVEDTRESPAFKLIDLIEKRGAKVDFFDPFVPVIPSMREHAEMAGRQSIVWDKALLATYDAALICTDHDTINYEELVEHTSLVVDTRNATRNARSRHKIVLA